MANLPIHRASVGHPRRNEDVPRNPWEYPWDEVATALDVNVRNGLSGKDAVERLTRYGPNLLREHKTRSLWSILLAQFKNLIVGLLVVATAAAFFFDEIVEGSAILAVILINALLGFITELRAVRSMEALYKLGNVLSRVRRDGREKEIMSDELVPGDVVILEGGDMVTADLRIISGSKLQADESALTGESVPVGKRIEPVEDKTPLAERHSMLYKGTAITRGAGEGIVVATGMQTELGQISALVEEAEDETTPLEERLHQLGKRLIWVTFLIATLVSISGILGGKSIFLMIETGLALAVAAIPEGLPIVATLALARGLRLMAHRHALVTRLSSVETLGSTGVICVDKTGTLTENRMTVTRLVLSDGEVEVTESGAFILDGRTIRPGEHEVLRRGLEVGTMCNNATLPDEGKRAMGDPMETALLVAGVKAGINRENLLSDLPEVHEEAFDPELKLMATIHACDGAYRVAVKGSPEAVINASTSILDANGTHPLDESDRSEWYHRNEKMAAGGLRVLALAEKSMSELDEDPYDALNFIGLIGLVDPPRSEVREAIARCRHAGIQVVMITGDQPETARGIATAVGLVDESDREVVHGSELGNLTELKDEERKRLLQIPIFSRVSPKQKLDLIEMHQHSGKVVAMTGDGVNDAPALKKADIGIAMGKRGTQVAREAADMVLQDDAFSSIVVAVEYGRIIFGNIRRFVFYLLSCNVSEVMVVGLAGLVSAPLPILPLQILFLNLVTDVFPALALGMGQSESGVMKRPPRDPMEPLLGRRQWWGILLYSLMITISVLSSFALAYLWLALEGAQAVTISFLTLALAQLWHVFNMRSHGSPMFRNEITRNPYIWGALMLCVALVLFAVYFPGLSDVLGVTAPGWYGWGLVLIMSLIPLIAGQLYKTMKS